MNETRKRMRIEIKELWKNFIPCSFIVFFTALLFPTTTLAQPGAHGGMLSFKLFKDGHFVNLPNKNWEIVPKNITSADSTDHQLVYALLENSRKTDFYYVIPEPTPAGGKVQDDFHLDIVHKGDTMRIFPPSIQFQSIELDSIPFKKGTYKIPQNIYDLKEISKKRKGYYDKVPVPNIYGDWDLFTRDTYKSYIEKTGDIDYESSYGRNYSDSQNDWRNWQYLHIPETNSNYYFYENTIVKYVYRSREVTIYEVKDYSDIHHFYSGTPRVSTLFYKNNAVFAIINKDNNIRGIYKLHFVEKNPSENLFYLEKKQVIEEYEAYIKMLESRYKQNEGFREREKNQATERFNEIIKLLENKSVKN
ncbi:MAG: hypothetical protein WDZ45_04630 [Flavobacteriaceae bacterium]